MTDMQTPAPGAPEPQQPQTAAPTYQPYAPQGGAPAQPPASPHAAPPAKEKRAKNVVGIIALVAAIVGFIFACVPGALIVGWILLPIAFILGIVAVCLRDKAKWQGLVAIILSVVGTIVGVVVFFSLMASAVQDAFDGSDVSIGQPAADDSDADADVDADADADAEDTVGTRANPAALGTEISSDEWTVVINSVDLDAEKAILKESVINEPADKGTQYVLVNYSATYTGDDEDGAMAAFVDVAFVTADGVTVNSFDKFISAPDAIDTMSALYEGATVTGNVAFQVPAPVDGVLAVRPGMLADKVFVSID